MAAAEPEDVTAQYAGDPKWEIPAGATEGYAWKVTLNPDAKWEDGTPINADSYIYSMRNQLSPEMNNYNASNYYTRLPIKNAENYYKSMQGASKTPVADDDGNYADYGDAKVYISFTQPTTAFSGYSAEEYYSGYEEYYVNEAGDDMLTKYGGEDYVEATDEVIADINYMLMLWYGSEEVDDAAYLDMAFYDKAIEAKTFEEVGFFKTGDYELTVILYSPLTSYFFKYYSNAYALVNEAKYEAGKAQTGDMIKTNYATSAETYMSYGPYKLASFQNDKEVRLTKNENWYGWTDGRHEGQFRTTDIVMTVVVDDATEEMLFLQGKLDSFALTGDYTGKYQGSDFITYYPNPYMYLLNMNNDFDKLTERQTTQGENKLILTNLEFRKGVSLSIDRSKFVAQKGYGKAMYGYISDMFISDVETGESYRNSAPAIETLKTFYGVSDVDEITGYDLDAARDCLVNGYNQALADGICTETDKFVFDYPTWDNGVASTREVTFLQDALNAATAGTVLEGRVIVNMQVNENMYDAMDNGDYDMCMAAWNGSPSDPYGIMEFYVTDYTSPQAYLGFDPETETLDIELNGTTVTKTYFDWYNAMYTGEYALADVDTRNQILASMELGLLMKYRDCPFWSMTASSLLSRKLSYPTYDYVNEVAFGGLRFMTYNYTDAEWEKYCADNNYQLNYQ
ncbi:MAG: ABC transporter substrate-binding protein [Lachnospiraceae bacterium]|nr:ABC transporter substrate-binding protein [Ruminococcus sp.]MCM1274058.1 ABC transporter substrate-binding protein [Lachnospiraceae bacterium]